MDIDNQPLQNDDEIKLNLDRKWSWQVLKFANSKKVNFSEVIRKNSLFKEKEKHFVKDNPELLKILQDSFDFISPLIYLNHQQRDILVNEMKYVHYLHKEKIYSPEDGKGPSPAFMLLKGSVHIYNNEKTFEDFFDQVGIFGYEGPVFHNRSKIALSDENSYIGVIEPETFLKFIVPFSKYATYLSRSIIHKDKTLDNLNTIKSYVLSMINKGPLSLNDLIEKYLKINSCLHPKALENELDVNAWSYALNRLPENIIETLAIVLINISPKILSTNEEVFTSLLKPIKTKARMRDTYKYIEGKYVVCVRELETDVLDFIANMCIHIIESRKIRNFIGGSPIIMEKLFYCGENFDQTIEVIRQETLLNLSKSDVDVLRKTFGNNFSKKMITLMLHHLDYSITINKVPQNKLDSVESWVQNLWIVAKTLLEINSSVDEIDDLVVDIIQGSKRTLIGCISPHLYSHADEIMKWGKDNNIKLQTQVFNNPTDKLLAYSYYYYKTFPEKQLERDQVEAQHGIKVITDTFGTGVQVLLINVNKLDPKYVDKNLVHKAASKNHLILHIGYTFGAQSSAIIKPLLMLFGSKARSMNIIGKAGGLTGNRTDILVANKIFYDKTHELCTINFGEINEKELINELKSSVHIGSMLTVAGTILQNEDLLHFYKHVMGCVGLEMEGFFFVKEIDDSIRHSLLRKDFVTRCFYYASDLPLDPTQNLSMEDGNVSWEEGVGSMNAIMRFIFKKIFSA